jgi:hypothetical protein
MLTRIENRHGGGVPDVHGLLDTLPFWLELKVSNNFHVSVSPHQVAWHTSYWARGGLSFFLLKSPSLSCFVLFPGSVSIDLAQKPWSEVQGQRFDDLSSMWDGLRTLARDHYAALRPCGD